VSGRVEAIHVVEEHSGAPRARESVRAVPGRGLEGDRHFGSGAHDLTMVEAEALEGLASEVGTELGPGESRRQVTTRGIALNELVGKRFLVGALECEGEELCEPCRHLESLTKPGVVRGLAHRGGLCARVLGEGEIAVGDAVKPAPNSSGGALQERETRDRPG
jgi:MOSC domain-containing protein YiiM